MKDSKTFEKMLRAVQKPGRYIGNEVNAVVKNKDEVSLRFAFCFPDVYEVAMSHMGMKILYSILNKRDNIWCERVFAPWLDMGEEMRKHNYPLFALESRDSVIDFDIVGFTLQYEMSYTNILYMLDLAGIPFLAKERDDSFPLIVGGGPCACNPEPVADFFDLFMLGDGEEVIVELCSLYMDAKKHRWTKKDFLERASRIQGVYVPSLYTVKYNPDGTISMFSSKKKAPLPVQKRTVLNLNDAEYYDRFPVPMLEVVHDRTTIEVLRGCVRGCRFCQAGFIYRPFRTKSVETLNAQAKEQCAAAGYDEISLLSLSTSDYPKLEELLDNLLEWTTGERVNLSLPSLRIDNFSESMIEKTTTVRKSGLTFAPEAGTQRMRDVINKNIGEDEILESCRVAFRNGYVSVKLYFMIGLPGETDEDIVGIIELAQKIVDAFYAMPDRPKGKSVSVNVSASCFVPKPFTPFEFVPQDTIEEFARKQKLLLSSVSSKKISVHYHDADVSFVEAVFARGDRRLSGVILSAYKDGAIFDSWGEGFQLERWMKAFRKRKIDPTFYANRAREFDEINPWELLDYGVNKAFLIAEYDRARQEMVTKDCRNQCANCGVAKLTGRACFADIAAQLQ